jgi:hypothetical protein
MERPKWSLDAANEARLHGDPQLGYDFSDVDKKTLAVDASTHEDAIEKAKDMEEARLEEIGRAKVARREFEDLVAYEFWKRENRYWAIVAVEHG